MNLTSSVRNNPRKVNPMHGPMDQSSNRRHFLKTAGALAAGSVLTRTVMQATAQITHQSTETERGPAHADRHSHEGVFAPDAGGHPGRRCGQRTGLRPTEHGEHGLAAMPDEIDPGLADRIHRQAAARKITIAALQGTFNMCHPDAEFRRAGLKRLKVLAESCRRLNTSMIALCTGTRDRTDMWRRHPDNDSPEAWRDMAATIRAAVSIAEPRASPWASSPRSAT